MIRLHYANRLENLIAPLADVIKAQQCARPLERVTVVIPSRVMEHFLKHRVSEAIGVAANLDFPFLRRFLAGVLKTADPKFGALDVEELEAVLFERLTVGLRENPSDFAAPRGYVEMGDGTELERELRTFHLGSQLARLFREYSITRRTMLQKWTRDGEAEVEQLSSTEKWQKQLWISTFDAKGHLRRSEKDRCDSEWMLLPNAYEAISASKLRAALPSVVNVFGLAYVGPAYARIFSQIGNLIDLNIYALNPCLEYWEDVADLSRAGRESWARRHSKVGSLLEQSSDPFNLDAVGDTPALRLWARPGREYIRMLNELTECDFDAHFTHRDPSQAATLLGHLQEDILNREKERVAEEADYQEEDESIRFLACPGFAREAEIVANEIWAMLEHDKRGRDAIHFHQIGVMVPDTLYQDYLPHIESAFSRLHQLPMNIVNRGFAGESPVPEAISLLLRLPLGRFARDEMLHLLNHPAIRGADAEVTTGQASRWCEELGIFFGADADALADTYIPGDTYNWDQGIRRLALGVFMSAEYDRAPRFYSDLGSIEYLPYETGQDEVAAVAAFSGKARKLLFDATEVRRQRLTLAQWSELLTALIVSYIHLDGPSDERVLERCVEAIESIASHDLILAPVSYQIVHEIISARIGEVESQLAQFTEQGIAIGPLSALRTIPFRAIFLLGLNEGKFPERERRNPMDLRLMRRKAGDVTATERDRYLFLESLLSARERIRFSYVARDAKTGDRLEPSSIVRELQFILRNYVSDHALKGLIIEHPLSRYDSEYFPEFRSQDSRSSSALTSYDSEAHQGAVLAALRKDLALHSGGLSLPGDDEPIYQQLRKETQETIRPALRIVESPRLLEPRLGATAELSLPISALRKFLECPLQGAAQYALGIFEDDAESVEQWQDEPIAQSILARTTMLREVFWKARGNREILAREYAKAVRISQLAGEAPAGPFAGAAKRTDLENMELWIGEVRSAEFTSLDRWQEMWMGRGDGLAPEQRVVGELRIALPIDKMPDRVVKIHGNLGFFSPAGTTSLRLVLREQPKVKDFLGPFLSAIALAAAEQLSEKQFDALVIGARKGKSRRVIRSLQLPSADQARKYLSDLAGDLLFGKNHYFLPIEAVEDVNKEIVRGRGGDLVDVVADLRDNEFAKCSSDYGPIRNARRFEPPSLETMKRIIERRFGPIRAIFERENH
jgi:exodeoxyribonuclease V gamma subunit